MAYDSLVLKKQIERFEQKTLEAEETMQKLRQVKELWVKITMLFFYTYKVGKLTNLLQSETPIKATDKLQDYAQSLILEPSSKTFESPE